MTFYIKIISIIVLLLSMICLNLLFKLDNTSEFNKAIIKFCKDFLFIVFLICLLVILFVTNG